MPINLFSEVILTIFQTLLRTYIQKFIPSLSSCVRSPCECLALPTSVIFTIYFRVMFLRKEMNFSKPVSPFNRSLSSSKKA